MHLGGGGWGQGTDSLNSLSPKILRTILLEKHAGLPNKGSNMVGCGSTFFGALFQSPRGTLSTTTLSRGVELGQHTRGVSGRDGSRTPGCPDSYSQVP